MRLVGLGRKIPGVFFAGQIRWSGNREVHGGVRASAQLAAVRTFAKVTVFAMVLWLDILRSRGAIIVIRIVIGLVQEFQGRLFCHHCSTVRHYWAGSYDVGIPSSAFLRFWEAIWKHYSMKQNMKWCFVLWQSSVLQKFNKQLFALLASTMIFYFSWRWCLIVPLEHRGLNSLSFIEPSATSLTASLEGETSSLSVLPWSLSN